jgi:WD40 repeat protein
MVAVSGYLAATERTLYWLNPLTLADARAPLARIHAAAIQAAAMSPDGSLIATGGTDGSVRIWDMTGQRVNEMEFPGKAVMGVAFVSQTHVAVVLEDGNLRVETIDTQELLHVARSSLTRGFTTDECQQFHFDPCPTLDQMRTGSAPTDR